MLMMTILDFFCYRSLIECQHNEPVHIRFGLDILANRIWPRPVSKNKPVQNTDHRPTKQRLCLKTQRGPRLRLRLSCSGLWLNYRDSKAL